MDYVLAVPAALILIISLINFVTIRSPWNWSQIKEEISVIIPMRNESENVAELINSLRNQKHLTNVQYLLLNDNSEDDTLALLHQHTSSLNNFTVINGSELPDGWIGKTWALQQLLQASRGEIIVSIDADVRLEPDAINRAVTLLEDTQLDFLSPYPAQLAYTWSEKLIQPLLQWSWMSTVILRIAESTSRPSMVVANGQFLVCKNTSYQSAGGHASVKAQVFDDIELLRSFYRAGFTGSVIDGSKIATCHMYRTDQDLISGYAKSLWKAFGGIFGTIFVNVFFIFVYVFPLTGLFTGQASLAVTAFGFGLISRLISARVSGSRVLPEGLSHPISILAFTWLNCVSWWRHLRGTNTWKSRDLK